MSAVAIFSGEFMSFALPPKSQVGYLDPEIANEGQKIFENGEGIAWTPPPQRLVMPDWSQIKKIQHYFNRKDYHVWPAMLYHKDTTETVIAKSTEEASKLGIRYRKTDEDERAKYGKDWVWDWQGDSEWRPYPNKLHGKFNPNKPETGKIYVAPTQPQGQSVDATVAAVMAALKSVAPAAPTSVKSQDWEEFQQFLAFKKAQEKSDILAPADVASDGGELTSNMLSSNQNRDVWIETAEEKGVKIDKRWSVEKIKQAIEKAA
jgi:hypothetical protein